MPVFGKRQPKVEGSITIQATPETVWHHVIEIDITAFNHPPLFRLLDIPKPLRAELTKPGLDGQRIAYFDHDQRFTQLITEWLPHERYTFTFEASPAFRVAYLFNLHSGPFQMTAGSYQISAIQNEVNLSLTSWYQLRGIIGTLIYLPVTLVMILFQRYLLNGIKANAERQERETAEHRQT